MVLLGAWVWGLCGTTKLRSEFQALDAMLCRKENALPRYNLRWRGGGEEEERMGEDPTLLHAVAGR